VLEKKETCSEAELRGGHLILVFRCYAIAGSAQTGEKKRTKTGRGDFLYFRKEMLRGPESLSDGLVREQQRGYLDIRQQKQGVSESADYAKDANF